MACAASRMKPYTLARPVLVVAVAGLTALVTACGSSTHPTVSHKPGAFTPTVAAPSSTAPAPSGPLPASITAGAAGGARGQIELTIGTSQTTSGSLGETPTNQKAYYYYSDQVHATCQNRNVVTFDLTPNGGTPAVNSAGGGPGTGTITADNTTHTVTIDLAATPPSNHGIAEPGDPANHLTLPLVGSTWNYPGDIRIMAQDDHVKLLQSAPGDTGSQSTSPPPIGVGFTGAVACG